MHAVPDGDRGGAGADRWVHLESCPEPRIIVGAEPLGAAASPRRWRCPCAAPEVDLFRRRDMQDMDRRVFRPRRCGPAAASSRAPLLVAPDRMRGRIARDAEGLALLRADTRPPNGRRRDAASGRGSRQPLHRRRRAARRRRAHEDLDARRARQPFQLRNILHILMRAAHPEGEVAMHPVLRAARPCHQVRRRRSSADWCWAFRRRR